MKQINKRIHFEETVTRTQCDTMLIRLLPHHILALDPVLKAGLLQGGV